MFDFGQKQTKNSHLISSIKPARTIQWPMHAENTLLDQQVLGNQATQQFFQSCPKTLPSPRLNPYGGVCRTCPAKEKTKFKMGEMGKKSKQEDDRLTDLVKVQPKLTVSAPDDEYEREADRVADNVMRMSDSHVAQMFDEEQEELPGKSNIVQTKPINPLYIQRLCSECENEIQKKSNNISSIQTQFDDSFSLSSSHPLAKNIQSPSASSSLPTHVITKVKRVLGNNLNHVRVHGDSSAYEAAKLINAKAFTYQNHIYLGKGQSVNDIQLMAHELTHVTQQNSRNGSTRTITQFLLQRNKIPSELKPDIILEAIQTEDYPKAFKFINGLSMSHMLNTLSRLGSLTSSLSNNIEHAQGVNTGRIKVAIYVVLTKSIDFESMGWVLLPGDQRDAIWNYLGESKTNQVRKAIDGEDILEAFRILVDLGMSEIITILMDIIGQGYVGILLSALNQNARLRAAFLAARDLNLDALPSGERTLEHLSEQDRTVLQNIANVYKLPADWSMSTEGILVLKREEGCKDFYYNDTNKNCTVGCGLLVDGGGPCESKEGLYNGKPYDGRLGNLDKEFNKRLKNAEAIVRSEVNVPLTREQYESLVNYAFQRNVGGFRNKQGYTPVGQALTQGRLDEISGALKEEGRGRSHEGRAKRRAEQFERGRHPGGIHQ